MFLPSLGRSPADDAIEQIKAAVETTYARRGDVVERNFAAIDASLADLHRVEVPAAVTATARRAPVPDEAPDFVKRVTAC